LPQDLQYAGEPPFEEMYPAHRRWFEATLGQDIDAALTYFAERIGEEADNPLSTAAVEAYLELLARVGRAGDALDAAARLIPPDRQLSRLAPTLLELAAQSGQWSRYAAICEARDDVLGFAAGLLAERQIER
jgi:hypothetical protein